MKVGKQSTALSVQMGTIPALRPVHRWLWLIATKDIPITDPHYWQNEDECSLESLRHVFRSCTDEEIPLLEARLQCLREAGQVLYEVSAHLELYT
jgi:hypothetical protein